LAAIPSASGSFARSHHAVVTEQGTIKTIGITDTLTIDAPEGQTVSRTSTEGVMIQFANQAREPVLIYWVDFNGNEIKYGRIEPGSASP
jgi:hypothetical protein